MPGLYDLLIFLHVAADVVWIGSILAVGVALGGRHGDAKLRGLIGREIYKKLSVPAFIAAFSLGTVRLALTPAVYFVATKFMHGKLILALVVIGLHHAIGARANKMAKGERSDAGPVGRLSAALCVAAIAVVYFAVVKPF